MKNSIYKQTLTLIALLFGFSLWAQDRGSVNGTVSLNDNTPAENISVVLQGTVYGAMTNATGHFEIKNIKPGTYTLRAAAVGIKTVEQNITVAAGQATTQNLTLSESQEELKELVINGGTNKFTRTTSAVVSKMPLKDIENPQVYNTVTAELLKEQVVTQMDDAYKNVPGLDRLWESTGRGGDGAGYFSLRGFPVQPTMVNGLPALSNGSADPQNVERIEVIKGPSGTLFGSSLISYGGLINVTTKKPLNTFKGNISYVGGTYDLNRLTTDVNAPFADPKKGAVRINAAYHSEGSFQDAGFKKSYFIAPSLQYNVNDKLSFFVNTEIYNGRSTNTAMLFLDRSSALHVNNINELKAFGYNRKRSYTSNDLYIDTPTFNVQGQMNYKINDHWTSQTALSRTSAKSDGFYSYIYEGTTYAESLLGSSLEGLMFGRYMSKQNSATNATDIQQNFIGDFTIGSVRNRIVVGLDYFNRNVTNNSSPYVGNGYIYIGNNQAKFNTLMGAMGQTTGTDDTGVLSQAGMNSLLANSQISPSATKEEVYSAYASDVLNITPSLSVMLSLRADRFINGGSTSTKADDYNQTAFSPKFGIVYQPILDKVSLFANYMDGFTNVAPSTDVVNNQSIARTFKPEHAKQLEGGTKLNLLGDKLSATFSYYYTEVNNMVYSVQETNADNPTMPNTINKQDGKQRNQGFEAFLTANPVSGLNVIAGYSYNDSKLVAGDADFMGKRPESAGPQNMVNLWASYKFNNEVLNGSLNGLGFGFGGNYASESKIFNRNTAGTFALPSYTVLNASAFYNINDVTISLKLDNLTNKDYYKGWSTISAQKPRILSASLSYNF